MKILISADMEGTCGIVHFNQELPPEYAGFMNLHPSPDYEWARRLLTQEVNSAIEGAFEGGADEVFVNEAHNGMRNMFPELLDTRARLINGNDKPLGMMQGVDLGVDGVICTGYHARANTPGAVMCHTYSLSIQEIRLNGMPVGEGGLNSAIAGHFNVPFLMICGDDKVVKEVKGLLGEKLVGVVVKEGISRAAAIQIHPEEARKLIKEGARKAAALTRELKPYKPTLPVRMEMDLINATQADRAEFLPGVERIGRTSVAYTAGDMLTIAKAFHVLSNLTNAIF
jgi:D-amino peptidase